MEYNARPEEESERSEEVEAVLCQVSAREKMPRSADVASRGTRNRGARFRHRTELSNASKSASSACGSRDTGLSVPTMPSTRMCAVEHELTSGEPVMSLYSKHATLHVVHSGNPNIVSGARYLRSGAAVSTTRTSPWLETSVDVSWSEMYTRIARQCSTTDTMHLIAILLGPSAIRRGLASVCARASKGRATTGLPGLVQCIRSRTSRTSRTYFFGTVKVGPVKVGPVNLPRMLRALHSRKAVRFFFLVCSLETTKL